jgi:hypothetical protein
MSKPTEIIISVAYTPTFGELKRLNRVVVRRQIGCWAILIFVFVGIVIFAMIFSALQRVTNDRPDPELISDLAYQVGLPLFFFVVVVASWHLQMGRYWNTAASLREPRVYEFTQEGIAVTQASLAGKNKWENIVRAEVACGLLILTVDTRGVYYVPLSAFPDQTLPPALYNLLSDRVKNCSGI